MGSTKRQSLSSRAGESSDQDVNLDLAVVPFTIVYKGNLQRPKRRRSNTKSTPRRTGRVASHPASPPPTPVVEPREQWEALQPRSSFMINQERFGVGHNVFVNHSNISQGTELFDADLHHFWAAEVLEIRANDAEHVYLRVVWYYWPDELPSGRRYYHGKNELVASNHAEIIHATTVAGRAAICHWEENDGSEELEGFFWRQRLDATTRKLTPVQVYCICGRAHNPDKVMIGCANPSCLMWLHSECVVKDVLRATGNRSLTSPITAHTSTASPTPIGETITPWSSPTKSDAEAVRSLVLPPRAITAEKLTAKPQKLTIDTSTARQTRPPARSPHIEGRIKFGTHGLCVVLTGLSNKADRGGNVATDNVEEEGSRMEGFSWEEKVHCLSCRMVIQ